MNPFLQSKIPSELHNDFYEMALAKLKALSQTAEHDILLDMYQDPRYTVKLVDFNREKVNITSPKLEYQSCTVKIIGDNVYPVTEDFVLENSILADYVMPSHYRYVDIVNLVNARPGDELYSAAFVQMLHSYILPIFRKDNHLVISIMEKYFPSILEGTNPVSYDSTYCMIKSAFMGNRTKNMHDSERARTPKRGYLFFVYAKEILKFLK